MAQHYGPKVITDGLIRCYESAKIIGLSGSSWHDLTGNENITLSGSPSTSTYNGVPIMHFEKDSNQYATFTNNPVNGLSACTFEFWVRFESVQGSGTTPYYQLIVFEASVWIAQYAGKIGRDLSDGNWFDSNGGNNTGAQVDDGGSNITTGKWYNPCFAWGGTTVSCYMNGVHQRSRTTTGVSTLQNGSTPRQLGRRGGATTQFDGDHAITRIYNRKLSGDEILQNHNACKGRFGL